MALHIVAGYHIISNFRYSKYFRVNLGVSSTIDKNGRRLINDKDKFVNFYYNTYKATIYAQGNVGDIRFYSDHYVKDNTIAAYYNDNFEEFLFQWDDEKVNNKGVDAFLGYMIKNIEEQYEERVKNEALKKIEEKPLGNAEMIIKNPGNVSYEDLKAFLEKRQKERYKNNETQ